MGHSSFIRAIRRPFRPLKRLYLDNKEKMRFKRLLRPTDVFIVGHPKSGNTLTSYMLAVILFKDDQDRINLSNLREYIPQVHNEDHSIARYSNLSEPRVFRNEAPLYPALFPKTIYLIRDPRAVLTSYYHMYRIVLNDKKTTLRDFIEEYLLYGCIKRYEPQIERWDKQVTAWVKRARNDHRVMLLRYEDILGDRRRALKKVAEFAGIVRADKYFDMAFRRSSFEAMRKTEEDHGISAYPGEIGKRGRFVRRGKTDGWKEELSDDLVKRIETEFSDTMKLVGYV